MGDNDLFGRLAQPPPAQAGEEYTFEGGGPAHRFSRPGYAQTQAPQPQVRAPQPQVRAPQPQVRAPQAAPSWHPRQPQPAPARTFGPQAPYRPPATASAQQPRYRGPATPPPSYYDAQSGTVVDYEPPYAIDVAQDLGVRMLEVGLAAAALAMGQEIHNYFSERRIFTARQRANKDWR